MTDITTRGRAQQNLRSLIKEGRKTLPEAYAPEETLREPPDTPELDVSDGTAVDHGNVKTIQLSDPEFGPYLGKVVEPGEPVPDSLEKEFEDRGAESEEDTWNRMQTRGIEALAFYAPFHRNNDWGIYVIKERLLGYAHRVHRELGFRHNFFRVLKHIWWGVWEHEMFHFQVELYTLQAERYLAEPIYRGYAKRSNHHLEEAMATAQEIRFLERERSPRVDGYMLRSIEQRVKQDCKGFPDGYAKWEKFHDPIDWDEGLVDLTDEVLRCWGGRGQQLVDSRQRKRGRRARHGLERRTLFPEQELFGVSLDLLPPLHIRSGRIP